MGRTLSNTHPRGKYMYFLARILVLASVGSSASHLRDSEKNLLRAEELQKSNKALRTFSSDISPQPCSSWSDLCTCSAGITWEPVRKAGSGVTSASRWSDTVFLLKVTSQTTQDPLLNTQTSEIHVAIHLKVRISKRAGEVGSGVGQRRDPRCSLAPTVDLTDMVAVEISGCSPDTAAWRVVGAEATFLPQQSVPTAATPRDKGGNAA